jgi:hypothetical protein
MARKKQDADAESAKPVSAKITLKTSQDTPVYYINYAETGFNIHEFTLTGVRTPAKISPELVEEISRNGTLTLDADIQIIIPPTVIPGLIYEQALGAAITDPDVRP